MTGVRRWPLFLIAAPAAVAVWSGWVGLGGMCGFGVVHPLPGIVPGFQLNTAICLPVGIESYGAYALGSWLSPGTPQAAQRFAKRSAISALALGMLGQVVYHLLAAAHATRAPWPIVVLVSCLPVLTLGFGATLAHLLRVHPEDAPGTVPQAAQTVPDSVPESAQEHASVAAQAAPVRVPEPAPAAVRPLSGKTFRVRGTHRVPEAIFAAELSAGTVPSIRTIKRQYQVGQVRALEIQAHLAAILSERHETLEVVS